MSTTPTAVRTELVETLRLDLVGPTNDHRFAHELLPQSPRRWYLTGFLVPADAEHEVKSSNDEEMPEEAPETANGSDDSESPEQASRVNYLPSSMGLSVLVGPGTETIHCLVRWGDYHWETEEEEAAEPDEEEVSRVFEEAVSFSTPEENSPRVEERPADESRKPFRKNGYRRESREESVPIPLGQDGRLPAIPIANSRGLNVVVSVRTLSSLGNGTIPDRSKAVSVFLVNDRTVTGRGTYRSVVFQTEIELWVKPEFLGRPDLRGMGEDVRLDGDEMIADLHYRDVLEYAVGHGVSAEPVEMRDSRCNAVRTCWIPAHEVERVDHFNPPDVELRMEQLGDAGQCPDPSSTLLPLADAYAAWIGQREAELHTLSLSELQRSTGQDLIRGAKVANDRIREGISLLTQPDVLHAFRVANRAMADAARRRTATQQSTNPGSVAAPTWRAFQLAFVLMNIPGIANPTGPERGIVDLLFFPTGGGKTEAYLGLSAFTLVLRRLRNPGLTSAGVSIIMRYTLRLLTLDQLSRASALMCALELERWQDENRLGKWPFEIGLWVGSAATPNRMGKANDQSPGADRTAYAKTIRYKNNADRNAAPIPMEECPWCGEKFTPDSFQFDPPDSSQPIDLRVCCQNPECEFSAAQGRVLPILGVDEPIYRRLPCFIIATVDKFAALPWTGRVGCLFGNVSRFDSAGFYGACDPNKGRPLPSGGLLAPDLIIQDELHLISGPLGTIAGIYETAIERLCCRENEGRLIRPKIVASTATVRRADRQIRALFGRAQTAIFPPPGLSRMDSFFARTTEVSADAPGRLYLGIAAQGRSMKVVLLRAAMALLSGAEAISHRLGGRVAGNPTDPYMTLLAYFNSLRELGGSRRIVEDEVTSRLELYWKRRRYEPEDRIFRARYIKRTPVELTSRVGTDEVASHKRALQADFTKDERVDVALATNMISVGLDIVRLGLMVVFGQPKSSSEYIQATSRVGRDKAKPGLVVTLLNIHRPRDRSHYERFGVFHKTFYRSVEATSVTPFSPRALDRALAGALVGLCRHSIPRLTRFDSAGAVSAQHAAVEELAKTFSRRALEHDVEKSMTAEGGELEAHVLDRALALLADWERLAHEKQNEGVGFNYQKYEDVVNSSALIRDFLDDQLDSLPPIYKRFRANRSMRDVEAAVEILPKESTVGTNS